MVYIYCKQLRNPEDDLKHCVEKLFKLSEVQPDQIEEENDLPEVLWSLYFTCTNVLFDETKLPPNVYSCSGPDLDLDYDNTVNEVCIILITFVYA